MKKKFLCFLLCGVLVIGLTGCGSSSTNNKENKFDNSTIEKTIDGYYNALHSDHDSKTAYKYIDYLGVAVYQYLHLANGYAISEDDAIDFIDKYNEIKDDSKIVDKINNYADELFTDDYYLDINEDANSSVKYTGYEIKSQNELTNNLYSVKITYNYLNTENDIKSTNDSTYVLLKTDEGYYFVDTNSLYVTNTNKAYLAKVLTENS